MDENLAAENPEQPSQKESKQTAMKEKLARLVCRATQKTNYRCDWECKREGECAYCLVMAEELISNGVAVPIKCKNCRYKSRSIGHNKLGLVMDSCDTMKNDDFCSLAAELE